jgi:hypothetical protein
VNRIRLPLLVALLLVSLGAGAQVLVDRSPTWASLTPAQKQTLAPLQRDWATIEPNRKQKWLELATKFPTMPADERQRVQARMTEWARLTPNERAGARMQFQEVRRLPAEERQAKWQAYQALSPEERQSLAQRAKPAARAASAAEGEARRLASTPAPAGPKSNVVTVTAKPPTRVVSPTVVQAKPGATTTSMSTRATPPLHHQAGLPKIAATPGFVDPATLLPKRGPQGAAVRAAASADPAEHP